MVYLNLQAIIDHCQLDKEIVALLLFPGNKFPKTALYRITSNESFLTSEQVYVLADFLGITIDELYSFGDTYKQIPTKAVDTVILKKGQYSININTKSGLTVIYKNNQPYDYLKVLAAKTITMEELFKLIDNHINNF
jgi:hypothetical protein